MNKKAQGGEIVAERSIALPMFGFLMIVITVIFFGILGFYKGGLAAVPSEQKAEHIVLLFTNTNDCFAFQDPVTKRIHPGEIDLSKFNKVQMEKCYPADKKEGYKNFNFAFELEKHGLKLMTNNYYEHADFLIKKEVLVRNKNLLSKDILKIKVKKGR